MLIISNIILDIHPIAGKTTPHHIEEFQNEVFDSDKELTRIPNREIDPGDEDKQIFRRSIGDSFESPTNASEETEISSFVSPQTIYSLIFNSIEKFFISPRWRVIPLVTFPYTACFVTSLSMTFSRCVAGMIITEGDSAKGIGVVPLIYITLIGLC